MNIANITKLAIGQWQNILPRLGIDIAVNKHCPCPACGGTDRFRFDDRDGRGTYICNQCGAGDGLDLIKKVNHCSTIEAAQMVADTMGYSEPAKKEYFSLGKDTFRTNTRVRGKEENNNQSISDKVKYLYQKGTPKITPYLQNKGLLIELVSLNGDKIIVPIMAIDGVITGAQFIESNGHKQLMKGTNKKGAFMVASPRAEDISLQLEQADKIIICEGLATGLSLSLFTTDIPVVCAVDAGNLIHVAKAIRGKYPDIKIMIAGDNDIGNETNVGKESAIKSALAVNGYYSLPDTDVKSDWDDYRQKYGIEASRKAFYDGLIKPQAPEQETASIKRSGGNNMDLTQMAASQRGELLANQFNAVAVDMETQLAYIYNGSIWEPRTDEQLFRDMVKIYIDNNTYYSPHGIKNAVEAMRLSAEPMGIQSLNLIAFTNGVYDIHNQIFSPHTPEHWVKQHNNIEFTEPVKGGSLKANAPNYYNWLLFVANDDEDKIRRLKAGLYMVLTNRYDWQLFLEFTGVGGTGKGTYAHLARLLAGEQNAVSSDMKALDTARGRAPLDGKTLVLLPDQQKYQGEGAGIKMITGGDLVEIDQKHIKSYSVVLRCVIIATNNDPMIFTERQGGISRRRVIFHFDRKIPDDKKRVDFHETFRPELPVIIRDLFNCFPDSEQAKRALLEQRQSNEALLIRVETDPLMSFASTLSFHKRPDKMYFGGGNNSFMARREKEFLYHAFLAFCDYYRCKPVSVGALAKGIKNMAGELGQEYLTRKINGRTQTNVTIDKEKEEYLPTVKTIDNIPPDKSS